MTTHRWITFTGPACDNLGLCDPDFSEPGGTPQVSFLECTLEPEWGCEGCGAEAGTGWAVLPDAIIGTGFGVVATCTSCLLEVAGVELPAVREGSIAPDGTVPA